MKKLIAIVLAVTLLASVSGVVLAKPNGNGNSNKPPGKLAYNLNIIGKGNYGNFDEQEPYGKEYTGNGANNGNRHTIFIPLKTDWYTDPCDTTGGNQAGNTPGEIAVQLPEKGVSLNIVAGEGFAVLDGDATRLDNENKRQATLQVDVGASGTVTYNVYVLAKGKPGGCLDLEAYTTYDGDVIFIGSIDVDRGRAKPNKINISNLLYVNGTALFADPYEDYFWQLYNNGLRLMNVRFYEQE